MSSADIMTRNQIRRVEIACPVTSPEIKNMLSEYLDRLIADNVKARRLMSDGNYMRLTPGDGAAVNLQEYYMEHPLKLAPTVLPKKSVAEKILGRFGFKRK